MRKYEQRRNDALKSPQFRQTILDVQRVIDNRFDYALIGGLAVAFYANPPVTIDADFLTIADSGLFASFTLDMRNYGWVTARLVFPGNRLGYPKSGMAFERIANDNAHERADFLFAGRDSYLQSVVQVAPFVSVYGVRLKIVRPEDLIIIKTLAGRDKDVEDALAVTRSVKVDQKYIDDTLEELL
jgi:predicted nucleotidyltransferase